MTRETSEKLRREMVADQFEYALDRLIEVGVLAAPLPALVTPIPNLNGNSEESLLAMCRSVLECVTDLTNVIAESSDLWHGRNMLPQRTDSPRQRQAQDAWVQRRLWLDQFKADVTTLALEILGRLEIVRH